MRKSIITILVALFASLSVFADGEHKVVLNEDNKTNKIELDYINIMVAMGEPDTQGMVDITVNLENPNEFSNNMLILFGRFMDEKEMRYHKNPRIVYDRNYPVKKPRYANYCRELGKDVVVLAPSSPTYQIRNQELTEGQTLEIELPIYIAIKKCKKKAVLQEKHTETLLISVELQPDKDYLNIKRRCDSIAEVVSQLTFCNNPKHKPSLEEREQPYKEKIDDLRLNINKRLQQWPQTSFKYRKYDELRQQLNGIEFFEADCGDASQHTSAHHCKYCKLSLEEIYNALDDLYQKKVYPEQELTKEEWQQAKDMYKCCTDKTCKSHAAEWKKKNKYKSGIIDNYKRIMKYYNSQK